MDKKLNTRKFKNVILEYLKNDDVYSLNSLIEENPSKVLTPLLSLSYSDDERLGSNILDAYSYASELLITKDSKTLRTFIRRLIWMLTEESGGIPWMAPAILGSVISCEYELTKDYFNILLSYIYENEDEPENYLEHTPLRANAYLGILKVLEKHPDVIKGNESVLRERISLETDNKIVSYLNQIQKLIQN